MKILATYRSGKQELLSLSEPVRFIDSQRLQDADGIDHFFNADGTYDGWGRAVNLTQTEFAGLSKAITQEGKVDGAGAHAEEKPQDV